MGRSAAQLTAEQLADLDRNGFLALPERFTGDEGDLLRSRLATLFSEAHPGNIIEQASGEVRTCMGLHLRDEVYARAVRHPRLLRPALQVLGEAIYIQQVKVNVKAAFSGEVWQWHYDFATHH